MTKYRKKLIVSYSETKNTMLLLFTAILLHQLHDKNIFLQQQKRTKSFLILIQFSDAKKHSKYIFHLCRGLKLIISNIGLLRVISTCGFKKDSIAQKQ